MARYNEFAGPKLPTQLLEKVYGGRVDKHGKQESSRKEKRKAERQAKKKVPLRTKKPVKWQAAARKAVESESEEESEQDVKVERKSAVPAKDAKPVKSILKRRDGPGPVVEAVKPVVDEDEEEDEEEEETDIEVDTGFGRDDDDDLDKIMDMDDYTVSRSAAKAKLGDDDASIAALEKLLGMKGKKSKKVTDDDWDFLINGDDGEDEDEEDQPQSNGKRKRGHVSGKSAADDEWLQNKRKKANSVEKKGKKEKETKPAVESESEDEEEDMKPTGDDMDGLANPFSDDEMSADDFDEYEDSEDEEDEDEEPEEAPRKRENPYIAPVTASATPTTKYIPPSLRQPSSSDEELLKSLRRQLQGQLNRLSEANLASILTSVLSLYDSNPRQHCTSVLVSLLTNLISDPSVLTDTFLILHAGFSAALYRSLGPDFGAQLLESIVQSFDTHHASSSLESGKQTLNLLAFLSTLYTLQATGHEIIFDYIRILLSNFSESNTELLLRVIRISGPQLRQDDPSALKDIVLILQRETSKIGEANLSIRTKFMIETILNLKNNRVKTGVAAKALSAEHMLRMKKILGGVKGVKTTEPLRITLADIRDSEKKGKWWLVGASWKDPAKHDICSSSSTLAVSNGAGAKVDIDDDDDEADGRDLEKLAKEQGMNTSVRSALFIAITGAVDFQHAQLRVGKLNLKNKQMLEIPRVLIHCVGMEGVYNHFYTLVAQLYAGDVRMKKAWQFAVYDVFRRLDATGEEGETVMEVRQVYNVAKMYASLVAEGLVRITVLKSLEFSELSPKAKIFVQVLISTVFVLVRSRAAGQVGKGKGEEWKARKEEMWEAGVKGVFEQAHAVPDMVLGLKYALEKVVRGSEVVGKGEKEKRVVEEGCDVAGRALSEVPEKRVAIEGDERDDSD